MLGWAVLALLVPAWLALVEVLWLNWRVAGVPVPLSVPVAVVGNLMLVPLAHRLSGSRLVGVLPALAWLVVAVLSSVRTSEGDLLLTGTPAGLVFLLAGVVAASFAVGRVVAGGPRPGRPAVSPPAAGQVTSRR